MNADQNWTPRHIDIEPAFNDFVPTFRGGQLIRDLMPNPRKMPLNADYLFAGNNVIAELKCLEKNPTEASDWLPRLARAFGATGHSFSDWIGFVARGEPVPDKVRAKLFDWLRDAIRGVVKAGNRQIRASKRELCKSDAKGVLLIANDNNYGFGPEAMIGIISDAAALLNDSHVDAVVYFTPDVFHRLSNSDVAWIIWEPRYRDETDVLLSQFVNDLGRKWHDHLEAVTGDPYVERQELDVGEAQEFTAAAQAVRSLGRSLRNGGQREGSPRE
jgi:hypothetical protein